MKNESNLINRTLQQYLIITSLKNTFYCLGCSLIVLFLCPTYYTLINVLASIALLIADKPLNEKKQTNLMILILYVFAFYNILIFPPESFAIILPMMLLFVQMFKNKILIRVGEKKLEYLFYCIMLVPWFTVINFNVISLPRDINPFIKSICEAFNFKPESLVTECFISMNFIISVDIVIRSSKLDRIFCKLDSYRAYFDELTGLMNRKILNEWKDQTVIPAAVFIDIDKFKSINDKFGHDTGDEVLRKFSNLLKIYFDDDSVLIREGGEEFVIIFKTFSTKSLQSVTKLMDDIRALKINYNGKTLAFTVSAGLKFNDSLLRLEELINKCDEQCYIAKSSGRDQLVFNGRRIY